MSNPSGSGSAHFFERSSNVQLNNPQFHTTIHGPNATQTNNLEHLHILDADVATNAILNAGGRADEVRCYPGTREEVISKVERWMAVGYREDRRIFWLSGPAGAGKSAIVQTLAERCIEHGMAMANFFFFRADGSRNHSRPVVATLLRQLMRLLPDLKALVNAILAEDSLILKTSLRQQLTTLIDGTIRKARRDTADAPPIILLIDGLDECDPRADLDSATAYEQRTLLNALHELVAHPDSPFAVLVSSRIESHIQMAFNHIGCARDSICLNEDYQPDKDIRLYISAELSRIKDTHPLGRYLSHDWPSDSAVDFIVAKSSGQFIYASTVVRFTENTAQSPAISVDMLLNVRASTVHSPFAEIDALYIFILSRCKQWARASEIVATHKCLTGGLIPHLLLNFSKDETASYVSDLTSIIKAQISDEGIILNFYHASFNDFIYSPERAGRYYINLGEYANSAAPRLILGISSYDIFYAAIMVLKEVNQRCDPLTHALSHIPARPLDVDVEDHEYLEQVEQNFLTPIKELYAQHEPDVYRRILKHLRRQDWIPNDTILTNMLSLAKSKPRKVFSTKWMRHLFR